jgi:hypothetical protein
VDGGDRCWTALDLAAQCPRGELLEQAANVDAVVADQPLDARPLLVEPMQQAVEDGQTDPRR